MGQSADGSVRAIVTADNHLSRYYDRLSPLKLNQRRDWLRRGFRAVVQQAIDVRADLFLQAGDLFDSPAPHNTDRSFVAGCLDDLRAAGVRVHAIGGNHDLPRSLIDGAALLPQESFARLHGLSLYASVSTMTGTLLSLNGLRVGVAGLTPHPLADPQVDPLAGHCFPFAQADVGILLTHQCVEGHTFVGYDERVIRRATLSRMPGLTLLVSGHVHQHWLGRSGDVTIIVPGATERMTFGELDTVPGFFDVQLQAGRVVAATHVPFTPQPRRQLTLRAADLVAGSDPHGLLLHKMAGLMENEAMVRLILTGSVSRDSYHALNLREVIQYGTEHCFSFDLDTSRLIVDDGSLPLTERGVRLSPPQEIAAVAADVLAANPVSDEQSEAEITIAARDLLLTRYVQLAEAGQS